MNARPSDRLAIAVAQLNSTVGDIAGNAEKVRRARTEAAKQGADLVVFPELFIAGYPPEDLVLKPAFQAACRSAVEALARETGAPGPALLVGTPWLDGGKLYNAVALLDDGKIATLRYKVDLPNYGVFDEKRVFAPGPLPGPVNFRGVRLGLPICEDIWGAEIVECLAEEVADIVGAVLGETFGAVAALQQESLAIGNAREHLLQVARLARKHQRREGCKLLFCVGQRLRVRVDRNLVNRLFAPTIGRPTLGHHEQPFCLSMLARVIHESRLLRPDTRKPHNLGVYSAAARP